MQARDQGLVLKAACLYTTAFLLTLLLHELGHALMSWALGGAPVLHNSYVDSRTPNMSDRASLLIALAGPVLSLVQGILFLLLARGSRSGSSRALFGLYLGVFGVINFLGYVMTSPFVPYGDLGQVMTLLHMPTWGAVLAAVLAAAVLVVIIRSTGDWFLRFVPTIEGQAAKEAFLTKRRAMQALIFWPWVVGSIVITVLSWPLPTVLSIIYPIMSPLVLGSAFGQALRNPSFGAAETPSLVRTPAWVPVVALLVLATVYRALQGGVAL
ncbi:hypothetical protein [Hymenobacter jejuensis]|uniref:M50 family metallopeptidase n=1 Tax=Hymenobacter jejuensis TaxID=2502781 RepID=A0A5B8A0E4_9BACT|nr:hypothetical protein [Hymenobacter jejuensis]QDA59592.1 hypothetical protein FHG12_05480 [Hymenobacter jejuensis]